MAADNTVRVDVILDSKTKGIEKGTAKTKQLREENERLSKVFQEVEKDAKSLDDRIDALTTHRLRLAQQLSENDDVELRKEFNRTNQRVSFFKKLQNVIVEGGKFTGKNGAKVLDFGGEGIRPRNAAMGIGAAALAPAVVPLGAMLGGAISGTTVGAAMAGGIIAASRDPSVEAAAHDFGQTISREFFASGDAFVEPIRNSLNILESDFQDLELEALFAKVAPQVEQVAHGIGNLAKNLMPGFNRVLDRSAAFTDAFAEGLGDTGAALGQMLDDMSSSEGAIEGLHTLFMLLDGTLVALGKTVNFLSDTWDVYTDVMARFSGWAEDIPEWLQIAIFGHNGFSAANDVMEKLNVSSFKAADGIGAAGGAAKSAAPPIKELSKYTQDLNDAFKDYLGIQGGVDDAIIAQKQGMMDFGKTLKENHNLWGSNTEAGLENQAALRDQVDLAARVRDARVKAAGDDEEAVRRANVEYDRAIARLKKMAMDAGIAESQFNDLAGTYTITFFLRQEVGKQVMDWSELRNAERQAESHNSGDRINRSRQRGFASGGTTPAFQPFFTHPGETMWSDKQHYVATKQQTDALRGGSGGMIARPLNLSGAGLGDMVFNWLVREVGNRGGTLAVLGIRE